MKKLYIFDFDGTLVNTFYDSVISYNQALKEHGLKEYEYNSLEEIDYTDFINCMTDNMEVLESYTKIYENSEKEHTLPYPEVTNVLKQLTENGKQLAICSNRKQQQLEEYTRKLFPDINFISIIGYTPEGGYKPQPEVMNRILDNVNYTNEEIIYVGDKKTDIQTAKNVGVDAVIVTWGQGNDEAYEDDYPIKVIDSMNELLEI